MANTLTKIIHALKLYYMEPLGQTFHKFRNGVIYFSVGLMTIYLAHTALLPSTTREILVLLGLLLTALGFFIAMMAHIRMVISRIVSFFTKE
ncbi:MAG: hypothetical protein ACI9Y1_002509 [Lentisphaeria bacterium]|jgi:hypothetical protein